MSIGLQVLLPAILDEFLCVFQWSFHENVEIGSLPAVYHPVSLDAT